MGLLARVFNLKTQFMLLPVVTINRRTRAEKVGKDCLAILLVPSKPLVFGILFPFSPRQRRNQRF